MWGLEGPEYLAWIGEQPEGDYTILMGKNTYQLMYNFSNTPTEVDTDNTPSYEDKANDVLTNASKVVFSSTLETAEWANTTLVSGNAVV